MSARKRWATLSSEASGHGWNQSMTVHEMMAGKRCARTRKFSPTGECVKTTCRFFLTFEMKWSQQLSRVSARPRLLTSPRMLLMMSSLSSAGKRSGMSPEASRSLMNTRNFSLMTWLSVMRNTMPSSLRPARLYIFCRSSLRLVTPYAPEMTMVATVRPHTEAASLDSDCLPLPPTPTSSAWPLELLTMRAMRHTCLSASSKSTRSMTALLSLYSVRAPSSVFCSTSNESTRL